jgi:hypothetical protein
MSATRPTATLWLAKRKGQPLGPTITSATVDRSRKEIAMKPNRLFVTVLLLTTAPMIAQSPVRLQFDVLRNGGSIAKPKVTVASGGTGTLEIDNVGTFKFTPTLRSADTVKIAFVIDSGGRRLQPILVIRDEPGSVSWTSDRGADSFEMRVSWVR